jgi:hypothetical protein
MNTKTFVRAVKGLARTILFTLLGCILMATVIGGTNWIVGFLLQYRAFEVGLLLVFLGIAYVVGRAVWESRINPFFKPSHQN